jgi:transcriptional regulator with XRE-family HTH domain
MTESDALDMASRLVGRERARSNMTWPITIRTVARRIGIAPGTLENMVRGRSKTVSLSIAAAVRAALVKDLASEIERLTRELVRARHLGADHDETCQVEALLAQAKALLTEGNRQT